MLIKGRINRTKFFGLLSLWSTIFFTVVSLSTWFKPFSQNPYNTEIFFTLIGICCVNLIYLKVKRLHDFNARGWWVLASLIPPVTLIAQLVMIFTQGTSGRNRFGEETLSASWIYRVMWLLLPMFLTIVVSVDYFGITAKNEAWQTYNSKYYEVKFPYPYQVTNEINSNVAGEGVESGTDKQGFKVIVYDYSKASKNKLKSIGHVNGLDNSSDFGLTMKAESLLIANGVIDKHPQKIEILSDKLITNGSFQERIITAKYTENDKEKYLKSLLVLNKYRYYFIYAIYSDDSVIDEPIHLVDYFFKSFKIIDVDGKRTKLLW